MLGSGAFLTHPVPSRQTTLLRFRPLDSRASFLALLVLALAIALLQSLWKLIWGDELITLYVARQPGVAGVWRALAAGADPNPPLLHLLVKLSTTLFGIDALALRLPSVACGLLAVAALWSVLRHWVRPGWAAVGVLAFLTTRGFDYTYDARSYSLLMGFAMASLACWLWARDRRSWPRSLALAGMFLALVAGYSSNYYGVLAFFPVAAGELTDTLATRHRLRWDVWLTLLAAGLPLLVYLPLIRHNLHEFVPHAWNRVRLSMVGLSYAELVEGVVWPVLGLFLFAVWKRLDRAWPAPRADRAALMTLLLYPVLGYGLALAGAGIISPRCVAPVCCGFGLAAGLLAERVFGSSRQALAACIAVLLLWVGVRETVCARILVQQHRAFQRLAADVAGNSGTGPLLIGDSSFVLPFAFYTNDATRARIVFPVDFTLIHRYEADDSGEQNLWAGRAGVFPFPIVPLGQVSTHGSFALVGRPGGWLAHGLLERDAALGPPFPDPAWNEVGGVFTPAAHPESRLIPGTFPTLRSAQAVPRSIIRP